MSYEKNGTSKFVDETSQYLSWLVHIALICWMQKCLMVVTFRSLWYWSIQRRSSGLEMHCCPPKLAPVCWNGRNLWAANWCYPAGGRIYCHTNTLLVLSQTVINPNCTKNWILIPWSNLILKKNMYSLSWTHPNPWRVFFMWYIS